METSNQTDQQAEATATLLEALGGQRAEEPEITEDQTEESERPVNEPAEEQEPEPEVEAPDFNSWLEAAGAKPEDFYGYTIPGTDKTWGEAKDAIKELDGLDERKAQAQLELRDRENEILGKLREASALMEHVPEETRAQVAEQLEKQHEFQLEKQRSLMLEAIPEWKDETVRHQEQQQVVELMRGYGFTDAEIGNTADHRALKLMRDFGELRALLKSADAKKAQKKPIRNPKNRRAPEKSKLQQISEAEKAGKLTAEQARTATLLTGLSKK